MGLFDGTLLERPVVCDRCGQPEATCTCPPPAVEVSSPHSQTARLSIEKRAKGKLVTVIRGLRDEGDQLARVLRALKTVCGAGGSVHEGEIAIQGRQLDVVRNWLEEAGYRVKG